MIQEIKYSGYAASPSDYECPDGQLALSLNAVLEDGSLKPVLPPKVLKNIGKTTKVIFIHKTQAFTHYIVYNSVSNTLAWTDTTFEDVNIIGTYTGVKSINALGNVLIMASDDPVIYLYWKDGSYIDLGSRPEPIKIQTAVSSALQSSSQFEANDDEYYTFNDFIDIEKFKNALADNSATLYVDEEKKTKLANRIFALLNSMIVESGKKGSFNYPFFIRFAYRLYDGTRIMYTAPHLIIPTSTGKPLLLLNELDEKIRPLFFLPETSLSFRCLPADKKWKDIITHVDVFVTQQLYGYIADDKGISEISHVSSDESEAYTTGNVRIDGMIHNYRPKIVDVIGQGYYNVNQVNINAVRTWNGYDDSGATYAWMDLKGEDSSKFYMSTLVQVVGSPAKYSELPTIEVSDAKALGLPVKEGFKIYKVDKETAQSTAHVSAWDSTCRIYIRREGSIAGNSVYFSTSNAEIDLDACLSVKLTRETDEDVIQKTFNDMIIGDNPYYLLYSIEYEKLLSDSDAEITITPDLGNGLIKNITVKENISDDYRSGDSLIASCIHSYNSRINIVTKDIIPYQGDYFPSLFDYPGCDNTGFNDIPADIANYITDIYFEIYENDTTYVAHIANADTFYSYQFGFLTWLFYPNVNAKRVYFKDSQSKIFSIDLKQHDFLNGAYAFNNFQPLAYMAKSADSVPSGAGSIPADKIYTSEVNNPFCFPATNINSVGTGDILGISSAAKALSQGQFGQFPLYAFTTEGVWALEMSSTGTYIAKQPITRDVCINADSITQIDSSVLFATARGIMVISGSETACLSDTINSDDAFTADNLPGIEEFIKYYNSMAGEGNEVSVDKIKILPFSEFLASCKMIYDYTNQHIIVYSPGVPYAYVYSLKSKEWGMIVSNITDGVNSYPDALAMLEGGDVANFSVSDASKSVALIISRPLKLGQADVLKTADTVIQRGFVRKTDVRQVLYGSRDLFNWHTLWSGNTSYMRGFRGTPYKYFRVAIVCTLEKSKGLYGCTFNFTPRFTNRLR